MYFDDMKLGMTVNVAPAVIDKDKMLEFAKEYDDVPLHTDEEYAKTTPFGKLIAPGVMSFMAVFAEDVLTGKATITDLVKRNEKNGIVAVSFEVYNQNGELVLTDVTEAIVKCRLK
jgi:acyl dehydratase